MINESEVYFSIGDGASSPFYLDGWLTWNEEKWGVIAEHVKYSQNGKDFPCIEGVLYVDKMGKVRQPPRNNYMPLLFKTSNTEKPERIYRQYLDIMEIFVSDLLKRGIRGRIALPPGFLDARPMQWFGLDVEIAYTFIQNLPIKTINGARSINKNINKASRLGYKVTVSDDWKSIVKCLEQTELIKGFSHRTSVEEISHCAELLGPEAFIGYLGYDEKGEPVSGGLRLMVKDGIVIDWSQGAYREHLNNGINQLLYKYVLDDVYSKGGKIFDWCGANNAPVALAKSAWGSTLVPYLTIGEKDFRYAARAVRTVLKRK
ncbi:MAG: hypothetical protein JEZ04_10765 [Spirochaetales bacterium]|nr:hypothetical protein [Spirochaetales bacterium]